VSFVTNFEFEQPEWDPMHIHTYTNRSVYPSFREIYLKILENTWKYLVNFLNVMPAVLFTGDSIDENQGDNSLDNPDRWV